MMAAARSVTAAATPAWQNNVDFIARAGLCLAFAYSGVTKLFDFSAAIAEQAHFGLHPPALFAAATIAVQLLGSALLLFGHGRWRVLGTMALAAFTLAATLVGHPFWRESGVDRFQDLNSFLEHFGLIGGFLLVALGAAGPAPTRHKVAEQHPLP